MNTISFRNDILPLKDVLYRLALRITLNKEEAEDIVQDTLIKVWNKRDDWGNIASIEGFCLTVCRNLALDRVKNKSFHMTPLADLGQEQDAGAGPYEQMIQRDRISLVRRIIDTLPEKQRSCMQLRDFEGKSYKEIAQIMEVTEEQVKVNIYRARPAIKEKYKNLQNYGL
jgi:RNA polymerase sigma-70 factor (ECF subfamily)